MILKVFDRRFASQLYKDEYVRPWTLETEGDYHQLIHNGGVSPFVTEFNNNGETAQRSKTWNRSQDEVYMIIYPICMM